MTDTHALAQLWAEITAVTVPQRSTVLIALGATVLVLVVPALWRVVRHAVTLAHESGHGVVATLTGRRVSGIRLHADSSGLTTSTGQAKRLPLTLVALAGYTGPAVLGVGLAAAVAAGYAAAVLAALAVALLVVLMRVRNLMGLVIVVVALALLVAAVAYLPPPLQVGLACGLAWLMLLGAVRDVVDLQKLRRRGTRGSDADALAGFTRIPGGFWVAVFWLLSAGCAVAGAWLLIR